MNKNNIACTNCSKNLYYFGDQVEQLEIECQECREERQELDTTNE